MSDGAPTRSDLLNAFRKLDWRGFEDFLFDLLQAKGFTNVQRDVHVHGSQIDLMADEINPLMGQPVRWAIEAKAWKERISGQVVFELAALKRAIEHTNGIARFVLACTSPLTAAERAASENTGIEIWDPDRLLQLAPPQLVERYFGVTAAATRPDDALLTEKAASLSQSFDAIAAGNDAWAAYQRLIGDTIQFLFSPPLEPPLGEFSDAAMRNRRDFIMENGAPDGFWSRVRTVYDEHYVVVDAKNYKGPLKKGPILDVAHYLKPHGCGMFGIIFSRAGAGGAADHAVREQWIAGKKLILVVSDAEAKEMLRLKAEAGDPEELLRRRLAAFRMSL